MITPAWYFNTALRWEQPQKLTNSVYFLSFQINGHSHCNHRICIFTQCPVNRLENKLLLSWAPLPPWVIRESFVSYKKKRFKLSFCSTQHLFSVFPSPWTNPLLLSLYLPLPLFCMLLQSFLLYSSVCTLICQSSSIDIQILCAWTELNSL